MRFIGNETKILLIKQNSSKKDSEALQSVLSQTIFLLYTMHLTLLQLLIDWRSSNFLVRDHRSQTWWAQVQTLKQTPSGQRSSGYLCRPVNIRSSLVVTHHRDPGIEPDPRSVHTFTMNNTKTKELFLVSCFTNLILLSFFFSAL